MQAPQSLPPPMALRSLLQVAQCFFIMCSACSARGLDDSSGGPMLMSDGGVC